MLAVCALIPGLHNMLTSLEGSEHMQGTSALLLIVQLPKTLLLFVEFLNLF